MKLNLKNLNTDMISKLIIFILIVLIVYLPTTNQYNDKIYDLAM